MALPFVENESIATLGSNPASARADSAAPTAMFASSSAVGSTTTAQSAKIITPSSPYWASFISIRKQEETVLMPGFGLMICSAGRSMSPVEWIAPETSPSASPTLTIMTPKYIGSLTSLAASSSVMPFALRGSNSGLA